MNYIEKTRVEIKEYFNPNLLIKDSKEIFVSPNGNFQLTTYRYLQDKKDVNWEVTKVEIIDTKTNEVIFDFFGNDSCFTHSWFQKDDLDYFICSEDAFGGQTVIDLTNKTMVSYSPNEDGFIWTDFYLSPDKNILATIGCYWACPSIIRFYDFEEPLNLPLKEISETELLGVDEKIIGWINNYTLKTEGFEREYEPEFFENNGFKMKEISTKSVVREIKADGMKYTSYR